MQIREKAQLKYCSKSGGKKMVGIISHVTELKEQIDHKLVVARSDKGSRVNWEIM